MVQPVLPLLAASIRAAVDLVLPPRCPGCGEIVDGDDRFCAACFAGLHFLGAPQCAVCGDPLIHEADAGAQCGACLAELPPYKQARAALAYGGAARTVVLALKHGRRLPLARLMARAMLRVAGPLPNDALIVPVPSHRWRLWQRGFNQAAVIARQMALQSGISLAVDALERIKPTASTKGMTRQQRRRNVQGAFRVARPDLVCDRIILLVDDVMTTGATVSACAVKLNRAGARHVEVLTFARPLRDVQNISAKMVQQGAKRDGTY